MSESTSANGVCEPCGLHEFERNRYFVGKLLTPRDMDAEQDYLRGKLNLHASHLHGPGTVCGLKVTQHPNSACQDRYVVLKAGLALDCCGHEIVVPEETVVDLRAEIEAALRAIGRFPLGRDDHPTIFVRLKYRESATEPVPALLDDCGCSDTNTECNRTAESYTLFATVENVVASDTEPLSANLAWQHTLTGDLPQAIVVDRDIDRLYVAEWDGTHSRLRMYDASNHSPMARVDVGNRQVSAATPSSLGDLVYVAQAGEPAAGDAGRPRITIFGQAALETEPAHALRGELIVPKQSDVVRLDVSARDDALLALLANGRLLRWSADAIRTWLEARRANPAAPAPTAVEQNLADAGAGAAVAPVDMTQSPDGRWLVVADGSAARLIVVNLAQFNPAEPVANRMKSFALPANDVATAVELSFDGRFVYVVCAGDRQRLYRIRVGTTLGQYIPPLVDGPGASQFFRVLALLPPAAVGTPAPQAVDLSVSPRDNWLYVSRRLFSGPKQPLDRGQVLVIPVAPLSQADASAEIPEALAATLRTHVTPTEGITQFHNLAFLGRRLYVVGAAPDVADQPPQGSISILYVDEAACDTFIQRSLDACPSCDSAQGVVIASIANYQWNARMVDEQGGDTLYLDNLTHRQMSPSTSTLLQVIQCMLEKGISEGIPGPRGPAGAEGPQGEPGHRGPGITRVESVPRTAGQDPLVELVPLPLPNPQGDFLLRIGLPPGKDGAPGRQGRGITEVRLADPPPPKPTVGLEPINADPNSDLRLVVGIPTATAPPAPTFNHVENANWVHDEVMDFGRFVSLFQKTGLVIKFEQPAQRVTLHSRSVFALVTRTDQLQTGHGAGTIPIQCDCVLPMTVQGCEVTRTQPRDLNRLIGETPRAIPNVPLVSSIKDVSTDTCGAVRLLLPEEWQTPEALKASGVIRLTVVLRSDWILDEKGLALDGNHIWPGVPFKKGGNGAQGGDWLSIIHLTG